MDLTPIQRQTALDGLAAALKLTAKERAFADIVARDPSLTNVEAARRAGYQGSQNGLNATASRMRAKPKIVRYVDEAIVHMRAAQPEANDIATAGEVWRRMTLRARSDFSKFVKFSEPVVLAPAPPPTPGNGEQQAPVTDGLEVGGYKRDPDAVLVEDFQIDLRAAIDAGYGPCIKSISFDREGRPKIELVDGMAADAHLAKWLKIDTSAPVEDDETRQARELYRKALENPEIAATLTTLSIEMTRLKLTATKA